MSYDNSDGRCSLHYAGVDPNCSACKEGVARVASALRNPACRPEHCEEPADWCHSCPVKVLRAEAARGAASVAAKVVAATPAPDLAADARDAARYRAMRTRLVIYVEEHMEELTLGLRGGEGVEPPSDLHEEAVWTQENAPFLTKRERRQLNRDFGTIDKVETVDRFVDWLVANRTFTPPQPKAELAPASAPLLAVGELAQLTREDLIERISALSDELAGYRQRAGVFGEDLDFDDAVQAHRDVIEEITRNNLPQDVIAAGRSYDGLEPLTRVGGQPVTVGMLRRAGRGE